MNLTSRYLVTSPRPPTTIPGASQVNLLSRFSAFALNALALEMPNGCHRAAPGRMRNRLKLQVLQEASLRLLPTPR